MEYNLVDVEESGQQTNIHLLQKERELKKNKYGHYFLLFCLFLASCFFIFWLFGQHEHSATKAHEDLVGALNLVKKAKQEDKIADWLSIKSECTDKVELIAELMNGAIEISPGLDENDVLTVLDCVKTFVDQIDDAPAPEELKEEHPTLSKVVPEFMSNSETDESELFSIKPTVGKTRSWGDVLGQFQDLEMPSLSSSPTPTLIDSEDKDIEEEGEDYEPAEQESHEFEDKDVDEEEPAEQESHEFEDKDVDEEEGDTPIEVEEKPFPVEPKPKPELKYKVKSPWFRKYSVFYTKNEEWPTKFCGVNFEPYFNKDVYNTWKNVEQEECTFSSHFLVKHVRNVLMDQLYTKKWKYTYNRGDQEINAWIGGRFLPKSLEPTDPNIIKRFTIDDGFMERGVGKVANDMALMAVLDNHDCDWRVLETYNLINEEDYTEFCEVSKESPDFAWLAKLNHSQHGHGMHLLEKDELNEICKEGHPRTGKYVVQEFMLDTALLEGYKFHVRLVGFIIADPFVTYWSPRHSFLRVSNTKYSLDGVDSYIDNTGDCGDNEMGCFIYDTDMKDFGFVDIKNQWKKSLAKMIPMSHLITKAYYGRSILEGKTSPERFTWIGFDYMIDKDWNPVFTEWNEEPAVRNLDVPVMQKRMGDFFNGMLSIAHMYNQKRPQPDIDSIALKYQFFKTKTIDDTDDWILPILPGKKPASEYIDVPKLLEEEVELLKEDKEIEAFRLERVRQRKAKHKLVNAFMKENNISQENRSVAIAMVEQKIIDEGIEL